VAGVEILAGYVIDNGMPVERLLCHPRRPLVAAFDGERPAAHVFDCGQGDLRPLATVGASAAPYGEVERWERMLRDPFVVCTPSTRCCWRRSRAPCGVPRERRRRPGAAQALVP
jgi:hypothetical protein